MIKLLEALKAKKEENKGFSLVELIIVIAIMAILVGVVGTQVVPYLNKSKEAKDLQIISAYNTAAVSAYSMAAGKIDSTADINIEVFGKTYDADTKEGIIVATIKELVGDKDAAALKAKMASPEGKKITDIKITFKQSARKVETKGAGAEKLGTVESYL